MKLLSIKEVCAELGIGRDRCETAIKKGHIKATKLGGFWVISSECIDEFRKSLTNVTQSSDSFGNNTEMNK